MNENQVFYFGVAILALAASFIIVGTVFKNYTSGAQSKDGVPPMMALEFLDSAASIKKIIPSDEVREKMQTAVVLDSFIIVPLYTLLFLLLSYMLAHRTSEFFIKYAAVFAILAAVLAIIAAVGDEVENYYTYKILQIPLADIETQIDIALIKNILAASNIKFAAAFFCSLLLSLVFLRQPAWTIDGAALTALFLLLVLVSFFGLVGLKIHQLVSPAMLGLILSGLLAAIVFLVLPKQFLIDF